MENTLENKARFFALYWGQTIIEDNFWMPNEFSTVGYKYQLCQDAGSHIGGLLNKHLVLKKLSSISDEDVIEYAINIQNIKIDSEIIEVENHEDCVLFKIVHEGTSYRTAYQVWHYDTRPHKLPQKDVDFIRSKGYALPWMGLSVEQLINYGWIKLKSE